MLDQLINEDQQTLTDAMDALDHVFTEEIAFQSPPATATSDKTKSKPKPKPKPRTKPKAKPRAKPRSKTKTKTVENTLRDPDPIKKRKRKISAKTKKNQEKQGDLSAIDSDIDIGDIGDSRNAEFGDHNGDGDHGPVDAGTETTEPATDSQSKRKIVTSSRPPPAKKPRTSKPSSSKSKKKITVAAKSDTDRADEDLEELSSVLCTNIDGVQKIAASIKELVSSQKHGRVSTKMVEDLMNEMATINGVLMAVICSDGYNRTTRIKTSKATRAALADKIKDMGDKMSQAVQSSDLLPVFDMSGFSVSTSTDATSRTFAIQQNK